VNTGLVFTASVTLLSSYAAVATLGWWLSGRFRSVEEHNQATMKNHEILDQTRHEENLNRFSDINVKLARLTPRR
jgi:hypothetical protein